MERDDMILSHAAIIELQTVRLINQIREHSLNGTAFIPVKLVLDQLMSVRVSTCAIRDILSKEPISPDPMLADYIKELERSMKNALRDTDQHQAWGTQQGSQSNQRVEETKTPRT